MFLRRLRMATVAIGLAAPRPGRVNRVMLGKETYVTVISIFQRP